MADLGDVLRIHLLGGFSVEYAGRQLPPLSSRPARLLLASLVLDAGRPLQRSVLAARLWPDASETRARRRLSHALWQVQDALSELVPGRAYIATPGDAIVFDADMPYWLDVEEFEARLDRVDREGGSHPGLLHELERSVELYNGDLLAGSYEPWALTESERLEQRYVNALDRLIDANKQRGDYGSALTYARRLTNHSPLREDAHREVMRLSVLLGRTNEALEQYARCRSVLAEELRAEPALATTELHERILRTRDVAGPRASAAPELASTRMVGRDHERVAMVDQLELALSGRPRTVFLEGEPGVGKSQLLAQVADDARWRGFLVLWGECQDPSTPYAPIRAALLNQLEPVRLARIRASLEPIWVEAASVLLPPLRGPGGAARRSGRLALEQAEVMREALTRVIVSLTELDPVALTIEDLHQADLATLQLLRTLSKRSSGRLLTLLSFRDVEAREDDERWAELRALDRDARPLRIQLDPLSSFETAELLRETLGTTKIPPSFVASVQRESGGNPLYVLELLRSLRDEGRFVAGGDERLQELSVPVTPGLRAVIRVRLERLEPAYRHLIDVAAVLGTSHELELLATAAGADPAEASAAIYHLVRRNLLESEGTGYRFSHDATRRVVLDSIEPARLARLHVAAADALEEHRPDRIESLAVHLLAADEPARALPYVLDSARRARSLHAYVEAADHLSTARELLDRVPVAVDQRVEVLLDLEQVLDVLGRRDEQGDVLDALDALAAGDAARRVEVAPRRATYLAHMDRFAEAVAEAEAAVAMAEDAAVRARIMTTLGRVHTWSGNNRAAVESLREAVRIAGDDTAAEAEAQAALGAALRHVQAYGAAERALDRALELTAADDDQVGKVEALGALGTLLAETGRTAEASKHLEQAIELARSLGYRHRAATSLVNLGTVRQARREPEAALEAYDEAALAFEELGHGRGTAMVQLNRAWLRHRWLGDDDGAVLDATRALSHLGSVGNVAFAAICRETLAGTARRAERWDEADDHLDRALSAALASGDLRAEVQVRRGRVELALARGHTGAALEELSIVEPRAARADLREFVSELASLRALSLLRAGRRSAAWEAAEEALEAVGDAPEPHVVLHRAAEVATAVGRDDGDQIARAAFEQLESLVAGLDGHVREVALNRVPEFRDIVERGRRLTPRVITVRMADSDAPRGRPLADDELRSVRIRLGPEATDPDERREQLALAVEQAAKQGARAPVEDLASVFDVSTSTVRRDLRALRDSGRDVATRGSGAG